MHEFRLGGAVTLNKWRNNRRRKSNWRPIAFFGVLAILGIILGHDSILDFVKDFYPASKAANYQSEGATFQTIGQISGQVIQVKDGDSFTLRLDRDNSANTIKFNGKSEIEVRLSSIDAPEYFQPYGDVCRQELSNIIGSQTISLDPVDQDKYDRIIAVVYIANLNVNREMVRRGCAWAYRRYLKDFSMLALEREAKEQKVRIWSQDPSKIKPPWQERREH